MSDPLIHDIDALLSGDLSGPEQVRAVLASAKAEMQASDSAIAGLVRLISKIEMLAVQGRADLVRNAIDQWKKSKDPTP